MLIFHLKYIFLICGTICLKVFSSKDRNTFTNEQLIKMTPSIVMNASIQIINNHYWLMNDSSGHLIDKNSHHLYKIHSPTSYPDLTSYPSIDTTVTIDNDVIILWVTNHYFHFMYETLQVVYTLYVMDIFELYPNATILTIHNELKDHERVTLSFFNIHMKYQNIVMAKKNYLYRVTNGHAMIFPARASLYTFQSNFLMVNIYKYKVPQRYIPNKYIYITRGNDRRTMLNEYILITYLIKLNFDIIYPIKMNIIEQHKLFSSAKVIITPHGNALTNLIFAHQNTTVIEFAGEKHGGNYLHLIRPFSFMNHHIIECKNDKNMNLIVNFTDAIIRINNILQIKTMNWSDIIALNNYAISIE